jgi:hypothetical protein
VIRQRLSREGGGLATVSGAPARFTRSELRDPAAAIGNVVRRGIGGGTGREGSGSAADMTPFFRRDPALSVGVRDQIVRSRNAEVPPSFTTPRGVGSGIPTPGTGGTLEGRVPRDGGGSRRAEAPATGTIPRSVGGGTVGGVAGDTGWRNRDNNGSIRRGGDPATPATTAPPSASTTTPRDNNAQRGNWRDRFDRPSTTEPRTTAPATTAPPQTHDRTVEPRDSRDTWRGRGGNNDGASRGSVRESTPPPSSGRSDVPRRIIDSIGGSRIYSGGSSRGGNSGGGSSSGNSSGNSGGASRGGNSGGGQQHSSPPPPSRSSGGESHRSSGGEGHVKRN